MLETLILVVKIQFLCSGRGICLDPANINYQTSIATLSYCLPILTLVILIIGIVYYTFKKKNYLKGLSTIKTIFDF